MMVFDWTGISGSSTWTTNRFNTTLLPLTFHNKKSRNKTHYMNERPAE